MKSVTNSAGASIILGQFRERIFDLKQDDDTLLRFLKYCGNNLTKAEEMLRKSVKWRKENNVESYLHWKPPKLVAEDFKFRSIGEDKDGHAVIYLPIGGWHTKQVMEMGYKEESFQFRFHLLEKIMESVARTKKTKFMMIMDMEGLTFKKCMHYDTVQMLSLAFKDFEDNFPERLRGCFIINAPYVFTYIYNTMKPLFSSKTLNKAKVFNEDKEKWKPILMDTIPAKLLNSIWNPTKIENECKNSNDVIP